MARIGIDASGGDVGAQVVTEGVLKAKKTDPGSEIVLYINEADFQLYLAGEDTRVETKIVPSSKHELRHALCDMKVGDIQAVVTATRSDRLLAISKDYLQEGLERFALIAPFPTETGVSWVTEVGATAKSNNPMDFLIWARLSHDFLENNLGIPNPRIGLANIAEKRACPEIAKIGETLRVFPGYCGYCEPEKLEKGEIDLLLIDGFGGNWSMKLLERYMPYAVKKFLQKIDARVSLHEDIEEELKKQLCKEFEEDMWELLFSELSYDAHLLAPVLGLQGKNERGEGIAFRVHGATTSEQFAKALLLAPKRYRL